jgi:hypothetical protein
MNPEQQIARDRLIEQYMQMIRDNGDASVFLIAVRNARQERIPPEEVADRVCAMLLKMSVRRSSG